MIFNKIKYGEDIDGNRGVDIVEYDVNSINVEEKEEIKEYIYEKFITEEPNDFLDKKGCIKYIYKNDQYGEIEIEIDVGDYIVDIYKKIKETKFNELLNKNNTEEECEEIKNKILDFIKEQWGKNLDFQDTKEKKEKIKKKETKAKQPKF